MAGLQERVKTRWLEALGAYTKGGLDIDGIKSAVENTLPAIIREETTEYAKEVWYDIVQDLQETSVDDKEEKHIVSKQFVDNIYKELSVELNKAIESVVEETLRVIKDVVDDIDFQWQQTVKHLEAKLKEEKAVIESIFAVEKRKFVNEVFTRVIDDIKNEMLTVLTGEASDLYASYVSQLIGQSEIKAVIVSDKLPKTVVTELKRELGKELKFETIKDEDMVVLVDTGKAKIDVSPSVIVEELVRSNLAAIRDTVLKGVVS